MTKYQYKTITLKQTGLGFSTLKILNLKSILNTEGKKGWRLSEIVIPSLLSANSGKVIVIFEREIVE